VHRSLSQGERIDRANSLAAPAESLQGRLFLCALILSTVAVTLIAKKAPGAEAVGIPQVIRAAG
jgi:hypothetical protein